MNALARWNQLNELADLQHSVGSLFSRPCAHRPERHLRAPQRIPLVAVSENARGYVLKVELPQVKQEDAKITIEDGTLTITGDRKFNLNRKKDHPVEHAYGRFAHSFQVPADARPAKVSAGFKKGVLTIHLAKNPCVLFASRSRVFVFPGVAPEPQGSN
jgi:HSP20 family protein